MTVVDEPRVAAPLDGRRTAKISPLISPALLRQEHPMSPHIGPRIERARAEITDILNGVDDRLVVVVGPCSIHDRDAALEYAALLAKDAERLAGQLRIVMRVYFEKPRTTLGWKGLINDPELDGSFAVNKGLRLARGLLLEVSELGLPVGCEFLDPIMPQYISDAVTWGAIGARTTESQIHRQLGSGLSMPVGFKNRTDGNVRVAVDAVRAAAVPHAFAGIDRDGTPAILYTKGNRDCHIILRGGRQAPNYDPAAVAEALELLQQAGLPERVMIDFSHDNSGKDPIRQPDVAAAVGRQIAEGNHAIVGVMLESFVVAGRQEVDPARLGELVYGQSITDACLDWERTVGVLDGLAEAVRARRSSAR
jgi:3-deoxy-7-phosphoheptulonate synthase